MANAIPTPSNLPQLKGREIREGDFLVEQPEGNDFVWMDELFDNHGGWNVLLYANANVDEIFGTYVETEENGDYLNIYAELHPSLMEVAPNLDITLCKDDGTDEYMERPMSEKEQLIILKTVQEAFIRLLTNGLLPDTITALTRLEAEKC